MRSQVDCEHDNCTDQANGREVCNDCGMVFLVCPGCSEAGGAGLPVYHAEPLCSMAGASDGAKGAE